MLLEHRPVSSVLAKITAHNQYLWIGGTQEGVKSTATYFYKFQEDTPFIEKLKIEIKPLVFLLQVLHIFQVI